MREIKFRAWTVRKDTDQITGWYDVDLTDSSNIGVLNVNYNYVLCQYTGLKDKNGVEIYEGDICVIPYLSDKTSIGVIEFHNGCFVFNSKEDHAKQVVGFTPLYKVVNNLKIIGNIYENPELLTKQQHENE